MFINFVTLREIMHNNNNNNDNNNNAGIFLRI